MPEPPEAGWWVSPGYDPRVLRYHDGEDWTEFECRIGLRGPGPITRKTTVAPGILVDADDQDARRLPPPSTPLHHLPEFYTPESGWFSDPETPRYVLARYWEHFKWTEFVCPIGKEGPGPIYRRPIPDWY
jgi:hypothetical protein